MKTINNLLILRLQFYFQLLISHTKTRIVKHIHKLLSLNISFIYHKFSFIYVREILNTKIIFIFKALIYSYVVYCATRSIVFATNKLCIFN